MFDWQLHLALKRWTDYVNILDYKYGRSYLILLHDQQLSCCRASRPQNRIQRLILLQKACFSKQQKKNADGKSVTCGKDTELCKDSYREQGPRESDCSSVLFTPSRSAHVCLMTLGVKTAAMFFQRKNISKLGREISVFSVPVMRRHPDFGLKWHIWWETLYHFIYSGSWLSHQPKNIWNVPLYPMHCSLTWGFLTESVSGCYHLASESVSWLVTNESLSDTSRLIIPFLWSLF